MKRVPKYDLIKTGFVTPMTGEGEPLTGPQAAVGILRAMIVDEAQENVAVLALTAKRVVIGAQIVSTGTLTQSLAHPREVFRMAIQFNAAAIVIGHNHPSGDPAPSPDDDALTRRMREAADLLCIPLLDHVIVAENGTYSYAKNGWNR